MKKLTLFLAGAAIIGLTSCEKCEDCTCSYTETYTFEDGFASADEQAIRAEYDLYGPQNYVEFDSTICAKKKDLEALTTDFEANSASFSDDGTRDGKAWSFNLEYNCTCTAE